MRTKIAMDLDCPGQVATAAAPPRGAEDGGVGWMDDRYALLAEQKKHRTQSGCIKYVMTSLSTNTQLCHPT